MPLHVHNLSPMHVLTTANHRHGGFMSACSLMSRLRPHFHVTAWSLLDSATEENRQSMRQSADELGSTRVPEPGATAHFLFYMNDYPTVFGNHVAHWRAVLSRAASVQMIFNRNLGGLPGEEWLADCLTRMYFLDTHMQMSWQILTRDSRLAKVPTTSLAPPVDLTDFLTVPLRRPSDSRVVIGRLAGDADVPDNAESFYRRLAAELPEAHFQFMPSPPALREALGDHPRFSFFDKDAVDVRRFLAGCDIFALTYSRAYPVPGPRSLMEAMAAGCAPVVIDREGPKDRVVHGESGFRSNDDDTFIRYVVELARDATLRERIALAARERSRAWGPAPWVDGIVEYSLGSARSQSVATLNGNQS